ncbi:MAG: acyl-CoA dehydratase activase [Smithellaceae bacterium]
MSSITAGVDIGSLCTKVVIIDDQRKILASNIIRSGYVFKDAAVKGMNEALESAGLKLSDIDFIVSTGYGRSHVEFSNKEVTEITCHARGAKALLPQVTTIIDIGGQDSKVIYVNDDGGVAKFAMNDKCAAGTGRFLEVMAVALQVDLPELGELWFRSTKNVEVSSMCTVFAESEAISLFAQGYDKADIAAGVQRAIARRVSGLVGKYGVLGNVGMTGGVAKIAGVRKALEEALRATIHISEDPQIAGAYGAAIIADDQLKRS